MERTEKNFPPDDTPKPLKRQGFSDSRFQNDLSFSSKERYIAMQKKTTKAPAKAKKKAPPAKKKLPFKLFVATA